MRTRLAIPLALALSALACQTEPKLLHRLAQDQPSTPGSIREAEELKAAPAPHQPGLTGSGTVDKPFARPVETQNPALPGDFPPAPSTMVIRSGTASIPDRLARARPRDPAGAGSPGRWIRGEHIRTGRSRAVPPGNAEIKVPAARFDDLITGLEPIGKVEAVNVTAEDVGEEFVDVSARMTNARRLESRLIELLATRTGRLQDVLSVERELARVREEIERYEGRLRYLQTHAATSSLSITVHEPFPVVGRPGSNVLVRAMERAWRNFVELVAAFIASLGVLVPVVLAGGTIVWGVRRWRRPHEA